MTTTDKEKRAAFALAASYMEGKERLDLLDKAASEADQKDKTKAKEEKNIRK